MNNGESKLTMSQRMCAFRNNYESKVGPIEAKFTSLTSKFNRFFYSNYYLLILLIVSFTTWCLDESVVGIALLGAIAIFVLVTSRDISPILPIMPLMLMVVSQNTFHQTKSNIDATIIVGVFVGIAVLFNIAFYRQRLRTGKLTIPFIMICVALFTGGIGSAYIDKYADGLMFMASLGPLMLGLYVYVMSAVHIPHEVDTRLYFAKIISLIASLAALEVLVAQLRVEGPLVDHFRAVLSVGWSNRAGLVIMLMLGLSSVFYYADNADSRANFVLYHFGFSIYLALMFTCGRGGMIFGTVEMIFITLYLLIKGNHKVQFFTVLLMWVIGVSVAIAVNWDVVVEILEKFHDLGFDSSERDMLYKEGLEEFFKYPIFGVGFGFRGFYPFDDICIYWFHSTILQIFASMGIVGAICYGTYYVVRIKILCSKFTPYNVMIIFALVCFELQSLIDSGTFEPLPFLFTAVLLYTFVEFVNREDDDRELEARLDHLANRYRETMLQNK